MAVPFLTQAYLVLVFRSLPACLASIEGTAYRRFTVSGQFFNRTRTEAATWPLIPAITDALIWQPGATLCAVNAAGRLNPPPFRCQSRHATAQALVMTVPFLTQQQGPAISPDYYKSFVLRNIKKITECCSRYVFVIDGIRRLGFSIGQHLIMRASVDGEIVTRQYTPVSPPSALGFFEVIIKVYPQGRMSKYIKTLKEGCSVDWRGPLGGLDYKPNVHKHMLLLAAGTGIAPMIQVLHHITSSDEDYTMVRLLFGIAKYREIYLKNELDELKAFWNVSILYCLSDETKVEDLKYGDEVRCREIDEELLEVELSKYRTPPHVLLCGPNTFNSRSDSSAQVTSSLSLCTYLAAAGGLIWRWRLRQRCGAQNFIELIQRMSPDPLIKVVQRKYSLFRNSFS
ncbi:NADH-cytochrome b5 reductase-like isoform X4 [Dermacentor albipictus]|uniref:NADH-cytochrome b5 reductase-like isoform X4 n=1 Tax=Dermacentor albipictus TaxID=60249 RepID=UPI0038FCFA07